MKTENKFFIPTLRPAADGLFDRYKSRIERNGWLFYIGGDLKDPKIVVVTPEAMKSQGFRPHFLELPIDNDVQFHEWVWQFIHQNGI